MYIILPVLGFVIWLHIKINKSTKKSNHNAQDFWSKERTANTTRKTDISKLNYITVSPDALPFIQTDNEKIYQLQNQLKELSQKKLLNLTGFTNTDLKLQYGPGNLNALIEYDQNYLLFIRTIYQLGSCLYESNYITESQKILEYGINCGTDISGNYLLLAKIYQSQGNSSDIQQLKDCANSLNTLMRNSILQSLDEFLHDSSII